MTGGDEVESGQSSQSAAKDRGYPSCGEEPGIMIFQ